MEQFYMTYECRSEIEDHASFFETLKEAGDKLKQEGIEYWIATEAGRQDYHDNVFLSKYSIHLKGEAENMGKAIVPFVDLMGPPDVIESKGTKYLDGFLRECGLSLRQGCRNVLDVLLGRIVRGEVVIARRQD